MIQRDIVLIDPKTLDGFTRAFCQRHGVKKERLASRSRLSSLVRLRHQYCYEAISLKKWSSTRIGHFINRDHSTVLYGAWRHAKEHNLEPVTQIAEKVWS